MTRQRGPKAPSAVTTTNSNTTRTAAEEVCVRLEAATANSTRALLGQLDTTAAHEGNVRLLERARLHLRVILEPVV